MGTVDRKNILIIDDEVSVREMIKEVLELHGFQVYAGADGADGLRVLSEMKEKPAFILLDLMMPGINGWQFLDLQKNDPELRDIPVVICSAFPESAKTISTAKFLPKPVQFKDLVGVVKSFCDCG